jgi:hypothetical protein
VPLLATYPFCKSVHHTVDGRCFCTPRPAQPYTHRVAIATLPQWPTWPGGWGKVAVRNMIVLGLDNHSSSMESCMPDFQPAVRCQSKKGSGEFKKTSSEAHFPKAVTRMMAANAPHTPQARPNWFGGASPGTRAGGVSSSMSKLVLQAHDSDGSEDLKVCWWVCWVSSL